MALHSQYSRRIAYLASMHRHIRSVDLHTANVSRENEPKTLNRPSPTSIPLSAYSNPGKNHLIGQAHICYAVLSTLIASKENEMTTSRRPLQTSMIRSPSSLTRDFLLNGH